MDFVLFYFISLINCLASVVSCYCIGSIWKGSVILFLLSNLTRAWDGLELREELSVHGLGSGSSFHTWRTKFVRTIIAIPTIRSKLRRPRSRASRKRIVVDRRAGNVCVGPRLAGLWLVRVDTILLPTVSDARCHGHTESDRTCTRTTTSADRQEEFTEGFHRTRRRCPRSQRDSPCIATHRDRLLDSHRQSSTRYVGPHEWLLRKRLRVIVVQVVTVRLRLCATRRRGMQLAFAWVPFIRDQRGRFTVADHNKASSDEGPVGQEFVEE